MCIIGLIILGVLELLLSQGLYFVIPSDMPRGVLEVISSALLVGICALLKWAKLNRLMRVFERWDVSYIIVAILSLMIFAPLVLFSVCLGQNKIALMH